MGMSAAAQPMAISTAMTGLLCGAKRRAKSQPCARPAGWGTEHVGVGRCKLHGGCTPSHIEHARLQLVTLASPAVAELQRLLNAPDVSDETKLRTVVAVLDRVGMAPKGGAGSLAVSVSVSIEERQAELLERAKAIRAGVVLDAGVGAEADH